MGINVLIGCKCCKCCPHNRASGACTSDGERHGMYMGVMETNNFHSHFAFILFVFFNFFLNDKKSFFYNVCIKLLAII